MDSTKSGATDSTPDSPGERVLRRREPWHILKDGYPVCCFVLEEDWVRGCTFDSLEHASRELDRLKKIGVTGVQISRGRCPNAPQYGNEASDG